MSKYLEDRVKELEEKVLRLEKIVGKMYVPKMEKPTDFPNVVWPQVINPTHNQSILQKSGPCYWDGVPESDRGKPTGIVCTCIKCNPWCNTEYRFGWSGGQLGLTREAVLKLQSEDLDDK